MLKHSGHSLSVSRSFQYDRFSAFLLQPFDHLRHQFGADTLVTASTPRVKKDEPSIDATSCIPKTGKSTRNETIRQLERDENGTIGRQLSQRLEKSITLVSGAYRGRKG